MVRDSLIPYYFSPGTHALRTIKTSVSKLRISGGGISSDKYLEELFTTPMIGIENEDQWKIKAGIDWERRRKRFHQFIKRHHLHVEGSSYKFPTSDRYRRLYEMAENYDFFFWYRLSRCHEERKRYRKEHAQI